MKTSNIRFLIHHAKSRIEGKGVFTDQPIPARKKIGELGGEIISLREARRRAAVTKRIAIVEFGNGKALDGSVHPNVLRYINHSCMPNTFMRVRFPKVEFYALNFITEGEELTCNYGLTHHDGKLPCQCKSPNCKGYL